MISPSETDPRRVRHRLTRRYLTALVLLAIAITAAEGIVQHSLGRLADDTAVVNLAGRQRLQSQRIVLAVRDGDARAAADVASTWAGVHRALLDGDPARDLDALAPGPARIALDALTADVSRIVRAVDAFAAAQAAGDARQAGQAAGAVEVGAGAFVVGMDGVVRALEAEAGGLIRRLRAVVLAVWLVLLALVVAIGLGVFRPAVEGVVDSMQRVAMQGRLLQTVIDTIPSHIYVKDRAGRAVLRNRASAAALGFEDPAHTVGLTDAEAVAGDARHDETAGLAALSDDLAVIETTIAIEDQEEPNGVGGWLLTSKVPLFDDDGEVAGLVGVSRDITARKQTQAALVAATAAAETAVRAKETFLANVGHEMRTPLHAVLGLSRLLAASEVSGSQGDLVHGISRAADTLLGLIDDLLDRARLDAGPARFHRTPFFLADVLADVRDLLTPVAADKGVAVEVAGPDGIDTLLGDAKRLRQVLLNLGGNAIKFTEAGSVRITAAIEGREADRLDLRFDVVDTGIGIPPDQQARIFEAFVQVDDAATRAHGGTGLGLSIVRDLVERQGGTVEVESAVGEGSRFTVRLSVEIAPVSDVAPSAAPATPAANLAGVRVLVVEDNPTNRLIVRRQAEAWGMAVAEAASGQEALDHLGRGAPVDLVLMDLQMPGMDGLETTRRLRAAGHDGIPVIALTASALASRRGATLAVGFSDFVLKPFEPGWLRHRIGLLLGRARPAAADTAAIDRGRLRESAVGDPDLERRLVAMFLDEAARSAAALAAAAAEHDRARLRAEAHALRGQAAYVGAGVLAEALERLESVADGPGPFADLTEATIEATAAVADATWALRLLFPPLPADAP
ncbi:ATP-binding protein [Rubrivirga sp. IMCC45206]|uniref:ATP-binding protein n=1 Tax=Rubrivirga sp. IMCC45206 TaxID=3391614 RepID=UPI00398FB99A